MKRPPAGARTPSRGLTCSKEKEAAMKVYGGDLVRAGKVIGRVKRTRVTLTVNDEGSETAYLLDCTGWMAGGEVWVNELEIRSLLEHGPHDYWPSRKGEGKRGYCRRCLTA